jgi:hypothetical protein
LVSPGRPGHRQRVADHEWAAIVETLLNEADV